MRPTPADCAAVSELVVWHPTATLDEGERRRVDEHARRCPACAEMLAFARQFQSAVGAVAADHPEPAALVAFVESPAELTADERARIAAHLALCSQCAEESTILEQVGDSQAFPARPAKETGGWPAGLWRLLAGSILRPVPAAIYLLVVVFALGSISHAPKWIGEAGSVALLPDQSHGLRGTAEEAGLPMVAAVGAQVLLLELTNLAAPPDTESRFRVWIADAASAQTVWERSVSGETFRENYTLLLNLAPGTLPPGSYTAGIADAEGGRIYRADFRVGSD